jgi:hypothetical protein
MTAEDRLIELAQYVRSGGSSDAFSGAKLFQQMQEGGGGGVPGAKVPNFLPYLASRVAETARAVASLDDTEQITVMVCYLDTLPNRAQQASALGIKPRALMLRLVTIRLAIDAWFSLSAEDQRRQTAQQAERQREAAAQRTAASQSQIIREEQETAWEQRMRACLISRKPAAPPEKIIS